MSKEFKCCKCGSQDVGIKWEVSYLNHGEYLQCRCHRCRYEWSEKPLDHKEQE